jgi:hypothetical protein
MTLAVPTPNTPVSSGVWGAALTALYNDVVDGTYANFADLVAPAYIAYTVAWTSTGTAPAIGNGIQAGRWWRVPGSNRVVDEIRLIWGSTTTGGTGEWRLSTSHTMSASAVVFGCGYVNIFDSGTRSSPGGWRPITTTTIAPDSVSGGCTATVPHTWAVNDEMRVLAVYEPD